MSLWNKLSIDWPCALGDWLWATFVVAPAHRLNRMTLRQIVVLLLVLTVLFVAPELLQATTPDLALAIAGDALLYMEVTIAAIALAARGHIRQTVSAMVHRLRQLTSRTARASVRSRSRQPADASKPGQARPVSDRSDPEPPALAWLPSAA